MMLLIFTLSLERELATSLCFLQIMSRAFAISESLLMSAFILSMMAFISDVAFLLDVVRLPISDATTEKPLPISPARAASIEGVYTKNSNSCCNLIDDFNDMVCFVYTFHGT